jgi:hypothetical protein
VRALIRVAAIVFTVVSTSFWLIATSITTHDGAIVQVQSAKSASYLTSYLFYAVPTLLYAVLCTLFCHWFARLVVKQVPRK